MLLKGRCGLKEPFVSALKRPLAVESSIVVRGMASSDAAPVLIVFRI